MEFPRLQFAIFISFSVPFPSYRSPGAYPGNAKDDLVAVFFENVGLLL